MKHLATEDSADSSTSQNKNKISANASKGASLKKPSAKNVEMPSKKVAIRESVKTASKNKDAKPSNVQKTKLSGKIVKNSTSVKTGNSIKQKAASAPKAEKIEKIKAKVSVETVKPKDEKVKPAKAKVGPNELKSPRVKTIEPNKSSKKQRSKKAVVVQERNLTISNVLKSKSIVAQKYTSRTKNLDAVKPRVAKKIITAAKNPKISQSKPQKTVEKAPTKAVKPKNTSETVNPKRTKREPKIVAKKAKTVLKGVAPKIKKSEVAEKTTEVKVVAKKTSARPKQKKNILAYAKPAIASKQKTQREIPVKVKTVAPQIEKKISEDSETPKRKSIRAISKAIFRGEESQYDFKVYEINENFKEIPAVYVISKRTTDKRNRGHHKLICIGQSDSILKDIKAHRKSKCLRSNEANVVSILHEEDAEKRLKIENDLKAAHSIVCNL